MIAKTIIEQFQVKLNELQNHDNFSVQLEFIDPPKSSKEITKLLKTHTLPNELLEFYALCDGIFISIDIRGLSKKMSYNLELRSADLIFEKEVGLNDDLSDLDLEDKNFLVIDILAVFGNYVIGYISEDGSLELYLVTFSKYVNKINLSFETYLEKSIQYLGIDLWQQFYIDDPSKISDYYVYDTLYDTFIEKGIAEFPIEKITIAKASSSLIPSSKYDFRNQLIKGLSYVQEKGAVLENSNIFIAGAPASHLMKARETLGSNLSDFVIAFYDQIDGIEIEWSHPNGVSGQVNLAPVGVSMGGVDWRTSQKWGGQNIHKKVIWMGEESELPFLRGNFLLEKYIGDSGYTSFHISDSGKALVNFAIGRSPIYKTSMTIEQYLEIHLELLGLWPWIYVLEKGEKAEIGSNSVLSEIAKIFPNFETNKLLTINTC